MRVSSAATTIGVAAILLTEIAVMTAIAFGAGELPAAGVMVAEREAIIEVHDQTVYGALSIDRILTPVDGWVVLRVDRGDGQPAELVGAAPISAGESRNVAVVLDRTKGYPSAVVVSLVADLGKIGEFEYATGDPNDSVSLEGASMGSGVGMGGSGGAPSMSGPIDKPLVAAGKVVTAHATIKPFNIVYRVSEADIGAAFLDATGSSVDVQRVDVPVGSWVVIVRGPVGDGPSEVIGSAFVPAGHTDALNIELSEVPEASEVSALLLADLGAPEVLEADPVSPARGVDAPYLVLSYFVQIAVIGGQ